MEEVLHAGSPVFKKLSPLKIAESCERTVVTNKHGEVETGCPRILAKLLNCLHAGFGCASKRRQRVAGMYDVVERKVKHLAQAKLASQKSPDKSLFFGWARKSPQCKNFREATSKRQATHDKKNF